VLAVFNIANAVGALPAAVDRQLVFYNTRADTRGNRAKDVDGQFLRVTPHDVNQTPNSVPPAPVLNPLPPGAPIYANFLLQVAPPVVTEKILNYFIAYSPVPGHIAPWDRLKFDWEHKGSFNDVYSW
jgi:hypothetical protein